jgi:phosphoribosylamine--glycine ligase
MLAVAEGRLDQVELKWDPRPALAVVAASKGYPGKYPTGLPISGLAAADGMADVKVFHSGTRFDGSRVVTDGGRVLSVTAIGRTILEVRQRAYDAMGKIHFEGMHFRRDIGHWAVRGSEEAGGIG